MNGAQTAAANELAWDSMPRSVAPRRRDLAEIAAISSTAIKAAMAGKLNSR